MIARKIYIDLLKSYREKEVIKVVTGVRRCGKSTLFSLYIQYLKSVGIADDQIITINLEDIEFEYLLNYKSLYNYVKDRLCSDRFTYVFIDEVQNCTMFEKAIDSLFIKEKVDVYITGSDAYMLSGELATLLSGRYVTIDMLPFSFKEYCEAVEVSNTSIDTKFNDYLKYGSFPYVATLVQNNVGIAPYIEGIYSTILIKDVVQREGITDVAVLESIIKTMASSVGSPISLKKIADTINSSGRRISVNTVDKYVRALTDSYIFYKVDRYDIKGRQHLKTLGKYYMVDSGIRGMLLSNSTSDLGHIIENIVYLELLRRGYKINIGKQNQKEIDFVSNGPEGVTYYQVSATVLNEQTLRRELDPLEKITDHHPKILLTLDTIGKGANYNGIKQLYLIDWLLETE